MRKEYLGDGLYVCIEREMFKVTSEDGNSVLDTIYFEPEVYEAFVRYAKRAFDSREEPNDQTS